MTNASLLKQFADIKQAEIQLTGRPAQDWVSPSGPNASIGLKLHFPTSRGRNLDDGKVESSTSSVPDLLIKKGLSGSFWFEGFFRREEAIHSEVQSKRTGPVELCSDAAKALHRQASDL